MKPAKFLNTAAIQAAILMLLFGIAGIIWTVKLNEREAAIKRREADFEMLLQLLTDITKPYINR